MIVILVQERECRGIYDASHDGRYLCTSSSPFIDGCRALLAQGADPNALAVMRRPGSDFDCLRGVLRHVAAFASPKGVTGKRARSRA